MQAEAEQHKADLLKYGLSEAVLTQFGELLDRFDVVVMLTNNGRTAHKDATQQLEALATGAGGGGTDDGCAAPAAVRRERAAAGVVGECE